MRRLTSVLPAALAILLPAGSRAAVRIAPIVPAQAFPIGLAAPIGAPFVLPLFPVRPAIPRFQAAPELLGPADGLRAVERRLREPEGRDATLRRHWDAGRPTPAAVETQNAERLPSFIALADPRRAPDLARALSTARSTRIGRRILNRVEKLSARDGRRVRVEVRNLKGDYGAYDYLREVVELDSTVLSEPRQAAATLIHELQHVLQHADGVPGAAIELELEAHLASLDAEDELGVEPGGFSRAFRSRLAQGPDAAAAWLEERLPKTFRLKGASLEELVEDLEGEVEELAASRPKARAGRDALAAARRDLELLRSPAGKRAYRRLSRRVEGLLRRRSTGR